MSLERHLKTLFALYFADPVKPLLRPEKLHMRLHFTEPLVNIHRLSLILEEELSSFIANSEEASGRNGSNGLEQQEQQQQQHQREQTDCRKSTKVTACNSSSISAMTGNMTSPVSRITKVPSISLSRDNRNIDTSASSGGSLLHLALVAFLQELHHSRSMYKQVQEERDRLKTSMTEANLRADLLAQEVELDHKQLEELSYNKIACLEKKAQEKIRQLESELSKERETFASKLHTLQSDKDKIRFNSEANECKLREQMKTLEKENKRMEREMHKLATRFCELEKLNCILSAELESQSYRKKMEDTDPMQILLSEQQYKRLLQELEEAKRHSKESQDLNDELVLEVERLKKHIDKMEHSARTYAHDKGLSKRLKDGSFKYSDVLSASKRSSAGGGNGRGHELPHAKAMSEEDITSIRAASSAAQANASGDSCASATVNSNLIPRVSSTVNAFSFLSDMDDVSTFPVNESTNTTSIEDILVTNVPTDKSTCLSDNCGESGKFANFYPSDKFNSNASKSSPRSLPSFISLTDVTRLAEAQEAQEASHCAFHRTKSIDDIFKSHQFTQRVKQILHKSLRESSDKHRLAFDITKDKDVSVMADEITKVLMSMPWYEKKDH